MKQSTILIMFFFPTLILGQKSPFTTQDVLNVKFFNVRDISKDGKMVAGTISTRRDRLNINHRRFGDPNYFSPRKSSLVAINTETGQQII